MVRFFMAGLCTGFPIGCYLREQGYHKKIAEAYKVLRPGSESKYSFCKECLLLIPDTTDRTTNIMIILHTTNTLNTIF